MISNNLNERKRKLLISIRKIQTSLFFAATCEDIIPEHGSIDPPPPEGGYPEGVTITFTCDENYFVSTGTTPITCGADGSWSNPYATCYAGNYKTPKK